MIDIGTGMEVEELRFVDEAFGKICNMVSDLSLEVKVQAAKYLVGIQNKFKKVFKENL
jgi:hypothetical protein